MKKAPIIIILLIAALVYFAVHLHHKGAGAMAHNTGGGVPQINAPLLDDIGGSFKTADWKGRVFAINFFGSWCPECRAEHDTLRILADRNVTIIGVAVNDNEAAVRNFLTRHGNPYKQVALDGDGRISHAWGITGVPETFIIDKAGIIQFHYIGPLSAGDAEADFMPAWNKVSQ